MIDKDKYKNSLNPALNKRIKSKRLEDFRDHTVKMLKK